MTTAPGKIFPGSSREVAAPDRSKNQFREHGRSNTEFWLMLGLIIRAESRILMIMFLRRKKRGALDTERRAPPIQRKSYSSCIFVADATASLCPCLHRDPRLRLSVGAQPSVVVAGAALGQARPGAQLLFVAAPLALAVVVAAHGAPALAQPAVQLLSAGVPLALV